MEKQQHVTRRLLRGCILLPSPTARCVDDVARQLASDLNRPIRASAISDQHLMRSQRICPFDREGNIRFLVQRRNDDSQSQW